MARMSKAEKNRIFWERVNLVKESPNKIVDKEIKNYTFICALVGVWPYGVVSGTKWKDEKRNGRYTVAHQHHHKGNSRSGKTSYDVYWFDVLDHKTGETFQVSEYVDKKEIGGSMLYGFRKNIYDAKTEDNRTLLTINTKFREQG